MGFRTKKADLSKNQTKKLKKIDGHGLPDDVADMYRQQVAPPRYIDGVKHVIQKIGKGKYEYRPVLFKGNPAEIMGGAEEAKRIYEVAVEPIRKRLMEETGLAHFKPQDYHDHEELREATRALEDTIAHIGFSAVEEWTDNNLKKEIGEEMWKKHCKPYVHPHRAKVSARLKKEGMEQYVEG